MSPRAATVRFYVDADTLGLAHALAKIRSDVTYPGDPGGVVQKRRRPACSITQPRTPDEDWLPIAGHQGWVVITRDQHIRRRHAELAAVRRHGVKLVAIIGEPRAKLHTFDQLEILLRHWRKVDELADLPGPLLYTLSYSSGLRPIQA